MRIKPLLLLPLLLLPAGCDPAPLSSFIDFEIYAEWSIEHPTRVGYAYWNRGDVAVHLAACDRAVLFVAERLVNGTWQDAGPATCPQGTESSAPVRMAPGGSGYGQVTVSEKGEYRLAAIVVVPKDGSVDHRLFSPPVTVR